MRWPVVMVVIVGMAMGGCTVAGMPTPTAPGPNAPFPPTWTPTPTLHETPTATLVVRPTPTWDGTPPPPSEEYVPRVSSAQLHRLIQEHGQVTVVDVRMPAAYERVHIKGAVNIPLEELSERIGELDGNRTIVFYGTAPNEYMSLRAAMTLYRAGFSKVAVLDGGLTAWSSAGYPVGGTRLTPTPRPVAPPWTVTLLPTSTVSPTAGATPVITRQLSTPTPTFGGSR